MKNTTKSHRFGRLGHLFAAALLGAACSIASGCSTNRSPDAEVSETRRLSRRSIVEIERFGTRAGFLDVGVKKGSRDYRFLFPDTPTCNAIVAAESGVAYVERGRAGRLTMGEETCDPSGILNLHTWRMKSGRTPEGPIKRSPAVYQVTWRGDGVALARGRFPLFSRLGIANAYDLIAVIPDDEKCAQALASDTASMEYRATGQHVLSLISGNELCPVMGVIFPDVSNPTP
jgi:hypothetical protein